MQVSAEFTIEPFVEGSPGPHVRAGIDAARAAGLEVDVGPFGTTVRGDLDRVLDAVQRVCHAAMSAGAERVSMQLSVPDG